MFYSPGNNVGERKAALSDDSLKIKRQHIFLE